LTAGIARGLAGGARKTKTHTSRPNRWSRVKILGGWYETMPDAITREKLLKAGPGQKKVALIHEMNPEWRDLSADLV